MTDLTLGGVYCDWDPDRAPYINVYSGGEFVIELVPVREVEASPGDEEAVVQETFADLLKWGLKAAQERKALVEDDQWRKVDGAPIPWPGLGGH